MYSGFISVHNLAITCSSFPHSDRNFAFATSANLYTRRFPLRTFQSYYFNFHFIRLIYFFHEFEIPWKGRICLFVCPHENNWIFRRNILHDIAISWDNAYEIPAKNCFFRFCNRQQRWTNSPRRSPVRLEHTRKLLSKQVSFEFFIFVSLLMLYTK